MERYYSAIKGKLAFTEFITQQQCLHYIKARLYCIAWNKELKVVQLNDVLKVYNVKILY
jgi:hypothetical protein